MCLWASITAWQRRLMLFTSRFIVCWGMESQCSWRAALRSLRFWGAEFLASTRRLSWSHRFSTWFRSGESAGHSIWGTPVSISHSLVMRPRWAGALSSMKMKSGLCCSCCSITVSCTVTSYLKNIINPKCRAVLYQLNTPAHTNTTTTTTKSSSGDNSGWCNNVGRQESTMQVWAEMMAANGEQHWGHWSLVQHKYSLAHGGWWCLCLVVQSSTLAGHLARRPHWWYRRGSH